MKQLNHFRKLGCLLLFLGISLLLNGQEQEITLTIEQSNQMMKISRALEEGDADGTQWRQLLQKYPEGMEAFGQMHGVSGEGFVELMEIALIQDYREREQAENRFREENPGYDQYLRGLESQQAASEERFRKEEAFKEQAIDQVSMMLDSLYPDGRISGVQWQALYQKMPREIEAYLSSYSIEFEEFIRLLKIKEEKGVDYLITQLRKEEEYRKQRDRMWNGGEKEEEWPIFDSDEAFLDYKIANSVGQEKENLEWMRIFLNSKSKETKELRESIALMRYMHNNYKGETTQENLVDMAVKFPEQTKQEDGQSMISAISDLANAKSGLEHLMYRDILQTLYAHQVREALDHPKMAGDLFNQQLKSKGSILDYRCQLFETIRSSGNSYWEIQLNNWIAEENKLLRLLLLHRYQLKQSSVQLQIATQQAKVKEEVDRLDELVAPHLPVYSWQQVKDKLAPGEAVVEMTRYLNYDPKRTGEIFYVANILQWNSKYCTA